MNGAENLRSEVTYMLSATTLVVLAFNIIYLLSSCDLSAISTLRVVALLVLSCLAFTIVAGFMYRKLSESAGVTSSSIILVIVMGLAILDITKSQEQLSKTPNSVPAAKQGQDPVSTLSQAPQQQSPTTVAVPQHVTQQQPLATTEEVVTGVLHEDSQSVIPTEEQPAIKSSETFYSCSEGSLPSCEFSELEVRGQQKTENQNILQNEVDFGEFDGFLRLTEEEYRDIAKGLVGWLKKYLSSASCGESVRKNFEVITEKLVKFSGYLTNARLMSEEMKKTVKDIYAAAIRIFKHYENKKCYEQIKSKLREAIKAVRIVDYVLRSLDLYRFYDIRVLLCASLLSAREYRALISSKLKKLNSENFISMIKEAGKREESELADDKLRNEELKNFYKKVKLMENDIGNAIAELKKDEGIIKDNFESCRELWESVYFSIYMCRKIVSRYYAFIDIMTDRNGMYTIADLIKIQILLYDSDRMKKSFLLFWKFYLLLPIKKNVFPDAHKGWEALVGISSGKIASTNGNVVIDLTVKFVESLLKANQHIGVFYTPISLIYRKDEDNIVVYNFYYYYQDYAIDFDIKKWNEKVEKLKSDQ